jgi:hypothetical protein
MRSRCLEDGGGSVMSDVAKTPDTTTTDKLRELVTKINEGHAWLLKSSQSVLERAIKVGDMLIEAKSIVAHGHFLKWIETNCNGMSDKTAERYMKLAENKAKLSEIKKEKFDTMSNLTLNEAIRIIDGNGGSGGNASDTYDKVEVRLIKKLQKLSSAEAAEAAKNETVKKLEQVVTEMYAAEAKSKKAA